METDKVFVDDSTVFDVEGFVDEDETIDESMLRLEEELSKQTSRVDEVEYIHSNILKSFVDVHRICESLQESINKIEIHLKVLDKKCDYLKGVVFGKKK